MTEQGESRKLLVDMLREAAQLEHCLLDAYLYTACSLKTLPDEFLTNGSSENRRRAVQFERVRSWRQTLLTVAHEEMLHLHYVQCLLRALGEPPWFGLPERNKEGDWTIPNWRPLLEHRKKEEEEKGVQVSVGPLNPERIRQFILYESSDSLQAADPFGPEIMALLNRLKTFELDFYLERVLLVVQNDNDRALLKKQLLDIFTTLTPHDRGAELMSEDRLLALRRPELPRIEEVKFQSLADFYKKGILPLYEEAFRAGSVKYSNLDLANEQQNPDYAQEGFLPVGPVPRSDRFSRFYKKNITDPMRHYQNVRDIISEIVEEGEGVVRFEDRAEAFLDRVEKLGGSRAYLQQWMADQQQAKKKNQDPNYETPAWLAEAELLRQSHLYRFAMIMMEYNEELFLAQQSEVEFRPCRTTLQVDGSAELKQLAKELPEQFNACYLVLVSWLSRMYEIRDWEADTTRRLAIEMLASWPLMSLAIRPFLELAAFFPVDLHQLFRLENDALPLLPVHARQLFELYAAKQRSEAINEEMDFLAMLVLTDAANWAAEKKAAVEKADLDDNSKLLIINRLDALSQLDEFEKQFPYRVHGGYSDRLPDLTYQQTHRDGKKYEEDPSSHDDDGQNPSTMYQGTLALRLRFSGYALVQLATDPDPPTDEAGCTGTLLLHAADGHRRLNRAALWQSFDRDVSILRAPRAKLPDIGVNCVDVSLMVCGDQAKIGYTPLAVMQSTGAVQTSGVQSDLQIQGFSELLRLTSKDVLGDERSIRMFLQKKDGLQPIYVGLNHLVSQDGEPIDPFILSVFIDSKEKSLQESKANPLFEREIFNHDRGLLQMSPLQRLQSLRGPCGFDFDPTNLPDWAMSDDLRKILSNERYPLSYLNERAKVLAAALAVELKSFAGTEEQVDSVISIAERLRLVSLPARTTIGWLAVLLHYGHTVSGKLNVSSPRNEIFSRLTSLTNLSYRVKEIDDRNAPNARWLAKYTMGLMDTDALSNFVCGELYVPLDVSATDDPIEFKREWQFPAELRGAVAKYACNFRSPFWADFKIDGNTRTLQAKDGTIITETLQEGSTEESYSYDLRGIAGLSSYIGKFQVIPDRGAITLRWTATFRCQDPATIVRILAMLGGTFETMTNAMTRHFGPHSNGVHSLN